MNNKKAILAAESLRLSVPTKSEDELSFDKILNDLKLKLPELDFGSVSFKKKRDVIHHFKLSERILNLFSPVFWGWRIPEYFVVLDNNLLFYYRQFDDGCGDMGGGWTQALVARKNKIEVGFGFSLADLAPLYRSSEKEEE